MLGLEVSRDFAVNVNSGEGEANDRLGVAVRFACTKTWFLHPSSEVSTSFENARFIPLSACAT